MMQIAFEVKPHHHAVQDVICGKVRLVSSKKQVKRRKAEQLWRNLQTGFKAGVRKDVYVS